MTTRTLTITRFLLARIAEDEADARFGIEHPYDARYDMGCYDPARVLAECEAKRRIVEELGDFADGYVWAAGESERAESALRALASVYADHPDYQALRSNEHDVQKSVADWDRWDAGEREAVRGMADPPHYELSDGTCVGCGLTWPCDAAYR